MSFTTKSIFNSEGSRRLFRLIVQIGIVFIAWFIPMFISVLHYVALNLFGASIAGSTDVFFLLLYPYLDTYFPIIIGLVFGLTYKGKSAILLPPLPVIIFSAYYLIRYPDYFQGSQIPLIFETLLKTLMILSGSIVGLLSKRLLQTPRRF